MKKVRIARQLERLKVDVIEAGFLPRLLQEIFESIKVIRGGRT